MVAPPSKRASALRGVDESGQGLAGERRAAGVRRLGQDRAVLGDPDGRRTDRRRRQQVVGVVEREQPDEVDGVGAVQVHAGRPDLREEGLGVTAEQVERALRTRPVGAVAVATVGAVTVRPVAVGAVAVTTVAAVTVRGVGRVAVGAVAVATVGAVGVAAGDRHRCRRPRS